jgi:hypothetical protein
MVVGRDLERDCHAHARFAEGGIHLAHGWFVRSWERVDWRVFSVGNVHCMLLRLMMRVVRLHGGVRGGSIRCHADLRTHRLSSWRLHCCFVRGATAVVLLRDLRKSVCAVPLNLAVNCIQVPCCFRALEVTLESMSHFFFARITYHGTGRPPKVRGGISKSILQRDLVNFWR